MSTALPAPLAPSVVSNPAAPAASSRWRTWTGRVMGGVAVLFLLADATFKFVLSREAVEGTSQLGWSASALPALGVLQLVCLVAYLVPRTAVLGAVLWTGYLGGAIATHARIGNPLFSHTLFPVYVALLLWGSLWLRDASVRAIMPLRQAR